MNDTEFLKSVFIKAMYVRLFEMAAAEAQVEGHISIPSYFCLGSEAISATVSELGIDWSVFPQHRVHGHYLAFGGNPEKLARELMELPNGLGGYQGSASIAIEGKVWGHDGLLSSQVPIATGFSEASDKPTLCILADASAEECYSLSSWGRAATTNPPIVYLVIDDSFSILTPKSIRRSWSVVDVARGFGLTAYDIEDSPLEIREKIVNNKWPLVLNVNCKRRCRHVGGLPADNMPTEDRLELIENELKSLLPSLDYEKMGLEVLTNSQNIGTLWKRLKYGKQVTIGRYYT